MDPKAPDGTTREEIEEGQRVAELHAAVQERSATPEEIERFTRNLFGIPAAVNGYYTARAVDEWRRTVGEVVNASAHEKWVEKRAYELLRDDPDGPATGALAFLRTLARRDAVYAVSFPVLAAAREETLTPELSRWHQQAARKRLEKFAAKGDELAKRALDDASALDRLARLVQSSAAKAWRLVTDVWTKLEDDARAQGEGYPYERMFCEATRAIEMRSGPVPWGDAAFAELVREIGTEGRTIADRVIEKSAERLAQINLIDCTPFPWAGNHEQREVWLRTHAKQPDVFSRNDWGTACWGLWLHENSHPRIYDYLAWALWVDVLRPSLVHEARNPPSLVIEVHEDVTRVHSQVVRLEESNGQRALVFDGADRFILVPSVAEEMAQALRGVGKLGTVTAHRALRWQLTTAHERAIRGEPDARVLTIDGGWSVYAYEKLGLKSKAEAENLKAITYAQDAVHVTLPDGSRERMLNLREWPAQGRRPGRIQQTLGTMLLPHYVFELGLTGRRLREAQRLIPVCALPPFVGRNRDHGPQATLSMLVVRELRTKARELAKDGAVRIPPNRWVEMARESALPPTLLGRVIDRWIQDGPDAPAFLVRVATDAYTLAPVHSRELAFILASGRTENRAVEAGKQSVRARQGKMRRLGRGKP